MQLVYWSTSTLPANEIWLLIIHLPIFYYPIIISAYLPVFNPPLLSMYVIYVAKNHNIFTPHIKGNHDDTQVMHSSFQRYNWMFTGVHLVQANQSQAYAWLAIWLRLGNISMLLLPCNIRTCNISTAKISPFQ